MPGSSTFRLAPARDDREQRRRGIRSWPDLWRSRRDLLPLIAFVAALSVVAGWTGLVAGLLVCAAWLVLPTIAVFALGQIVVVAVLPDEPTIVTMLVVILPLSGLLFTTTLSGRLIRDGLALVGMSSLFFTILVGLYRMTASIWLTGFALIGVAGVGVSLVAFTHVHKLPGRDNE